MKIAIYAICKNEMKFAKRFAESIKNAKQQPDGVYITDTGSTDGTQELLRSYGFNVYDEKIDPWRFDVARNVSLSKVPDDVEVAICPDLDDVFLPDWREGIEKYWKEGITKTISYLYVNNWEKDDITPKVTLWGFKIHTPKDWTWINPIHEVLKPNFEIKIEHVVATALKIIEHRSEEKEERFSRLKIFDQFAEELKDDERMLFLYGKELYAHKEYDRSKKIMLKYMDKSKPYCINGIEDDGTMHQRSYACRLIANCCIFEGKQAGEVMSWFIRSAAENTMQREPWFYLAKAWDQLGESAHAYSALKIAKEITNPLTSLEIEGEAWDERFVELYDRSKEGVKTSLFYTNEIEGWMTNGELIHLYNAAKRVDSIVEIGSWKGRSTHALLSGCPNGTVYAVDHFMGTVSDGDAHKEAFEDSETVFKQFKKNLKKFRNLRTLRMTSGEAVKQFEDKSVDMVFIDGEHTYEAAKRDIELWLPKAKMVICGHDFYFPGVRQAVDEAFGEENIMTSESIWSFRIKE